ACVVFFFLFFFSSRRRHTRSYGDWSSDVCSSDLTVTDVGSTKGPVCAAAAGAARFIGGHPVCGSEAHGPEHARAELFDGATWFRSEERRVGKECRSGWSADYLKEKREEEKKDDIE